MITAKGRITKPAGKTFETKYGEKRMAIVTLENGNEEKFYLVPNHPACNCNREDLVTVIYEERNGRQTRRLVAEEGNSQPHNSRPNTSSNPSNNGNNNNPGQQKQSFPKREINPRQWATNEARNIIALMNIVESEAGKGGYPDLSTEELRTVAISIVINAQRTFSGQVDFSEPEVEDQEEDNDDEETPLF